MPLLTGKELLVPARAVRRTVCAFNIVNYETAAAVLAAAEAEKFPVILQVFHRLFNDAKAERIAPMLRKMAENCQVNVAIHLDHGVTFEHVRQAVEYGFTSVMFDGSKLSPEKNIEETRKAVEHAHRHGVSVEGEIGHVPSSGAEGVPLSTPEEAEEFARKTGVDALAVAIGTQHGYYKIEPKIEVDLARRIGERVAIPLVLHGGSGTPLSAVRQVIACGFAKVNIATEFMDTYLKALRKHLNAVDSFTPVDLVMNPVVEETSAYVRSMMQSFNISTSAEREGN